MTPTRIDTTGDPLGRLVAEALRAEAERIAVEDRWAAIAVRLSSPVPPSPTARPSHGRRRVRILAVALCSLAVAVVIMVAATVSGWRLFDGSEPAGQLIPTTVPRYNPAIPNLVVYRSNISEASNTQDPAGFYLSPELRRTDSADLGVAALNALLEVFPVRGDRTGFGEGHHADGRIDPIAIHDWAHWQKADVTSVSHTGGLIRVELNGFFSHLGGSKGAELMVQAWVYTLQDTLGSRDDVLITLQGRPFLMYGEVDTTKPIKRDESVRIKHVTGFDSPVESDVVSSPLAILGYADAAPGRPARLWIVNLTTGQIVVDDQLTASTQELALVQDLQLGRHQIHLEGIEPSGDRYSHQIVITVVR